MLLYFLMSCSMKSSPVASSSATSRAAVKLAPVPTSLLQRRQQRLSSPQVVAEQQQMGSRLPETLRLNLQTATKRRRGLEVRSRNLEALSAVFFPFPVLYWCHLIFWKVILVNYPLLSPLLLSGIQRVCRCCRCAVGGNISLSGFVQQSRDDGWTTSVFVCCQ